MKKDFKMIITIIIWIVCVISLTKMIDAYTYYSNDDYEDLNNALYPGFDMEDLVDQFDYEALDGLSLGKYIRGYNFRKYIEC